MPVNKAGVVFSTPHQTYPHVKYMSYTFHFTGLWITQITQGESDRSTPKIRTKQERFQSISETFLKHMHCAQHAKNKGGEQGSIEVVRKSRQHKDSRMPSINETTCSRRRDTCIILVNIIFTCESPALGQSIFTFGSCLAFRASSHASVISPAHGKGFL